jgi:hypothetical protein
LKGSNVEPQISGEFASAFVLVMVIIGLFVGLTVTIITLVAYCKITAKAGYHWALGILMIVPLGNIIFPLFLAFADWPVHRELRQLKPQGRGLPI